MNVPATEAVNAQPVAILRRLLQQVKDLADAEEVASELGHLLAETPPEADAARKLRLECVKTAQRSSSEGVAAQLRFCSKLLAAYERSRGAEEEKADALVGLSPEDRAVLNRLRQGPATPSDLCGGRDNGALSRRLKRLEERGLVETGVGQDSRARPRLLTTFGRVVAARIEEERPAASASAEQPHPATQDLVHASVECTLRALKAVQTHSATPVTRREVALMVPKKVRALNFVDAFERFAEGFDLVDVDAEGGYWDPRRNERLQIWTEMFHTLSNEAACRQLFRTLEGKHLQLMTVASRREDWLRCMKPLSQRIDVVTLEEFSRDTESAVDTLVVDDPTLAQRVASRRSTKVKTFAHTPGGSLTLQSIHP